MFCIASMKTLTIIGTPSIWVNDDVRSPVTSGGWLVCLCLYIYIHIYIYMYIYIYITPTRVPIFLVSVPAWLFKPQLLILIPFNILTSGRQTHPFKYPKIESEIAHILRAKGFFEFLPNVWEKMVANFDSYVQWSGDCSSTMAEQILRRSFFRTLLSRCLTCILFPENMTIIPTCFFKSSLSLHFFAFSPLPFLPTKNRGVATRVM